VAQKKRVLVLVPGNADQAQGIGETILRASGAGESVAFEFKPVRLSPAWWDSAQDWLVGEIAYFEAGADAQAEGYDAICVLSAGDMAIKHLRSVMDIPVIGGGKTAYLAALMVGSRFSLLIHWEPWRFFYKDGIDAAGLTSLCASIRSVNPSIGKKDVGDWYEARSEEAKARVVDAARKCVTDDGADVIVMPVGLYWAYDAVKSNVPVPVVSAGPLVLRTVEVLLGLGLSHSPVGDPRAKKPEIGMFHDMVTAAVASRAGKG
jgi:allantoin racemase